MDHSARESPSTYVYDEINSENKELRVITLLPDTFEADVHIRVSTITFDIDAEGKNIYEALSYTWGNVNDRKTIYIDGGEQSWILEVTRNCEEALHYLRYRDKPRTLWIDAICINQADPQERARQVSIMGPIYSKASQVVVWLGPAKDDSDMAMRWIDNVGRKIAYDVSTDQLLPLTGDAQNCSDSGPDLAESESEALASLLERKYLERLWVWQEVNMGGDGAKLKCGESETFFRHLITALNYNRHVPRGHPDALSRILSRYMFLQYLPYAGRFPKLEVVDRMRECLCSDERDRIFTSLGFGEHWRNELRPDYTSSLEDVFTDFVLKYIEEFERLDFLRYIGDYTHRGKASVIGALPSWVPDWSQRSTAYQVYPPRASASSSSSIISADRKRLIVRGRLIDTVQKTTPLGNETTAGVEFDLESWSETVWSCVRAAFPTPPDHDTIGKLARILSCDDVAERYIPPSEHMANLEEGVVFLTQLLQSGGVADDSVDEKFKFAGSVVAKCRGRSIFTTGEGRLGLGCSKVRSGDVLAVLLGCALIIILRPVNSETHQYRVVGNTYCTDLLDGEAILGPLTGPWETVNTVPSDWSNYLPAFRNTQTGHVQYEDPRLPPLPEEWMYVSDDVPNHVPVFESTMTGEKRLYLHDPRLDASALEERGVQLQEICLV